MKKNKNDVEVASLDGETSVGEKELEKSSSDINTADDGHEAEVSSIDIVQKNEVGVTQIDSSKNGDSLFDFFINYKSGSSYDAVVDETIDEVIMKLNHARKIITSDMTWSIVMEVSGEVEYGREDEEIDDDDDDDSTCDESIEDVQLKKFKSEPYDINGVKH